jgi:type I restriction enzyme, S subunit
MRRDWPIKTIAECASPEPYSTQIGPFGKALMADQYTKSGVPVLRGVNVNRGRFHDGDFVFIDAATADRLNKFESYPGDVLLVHKGTLGQIGLMPNQRKYSRYIMGNSMMRVRCDMTKLLPEYLYYWLSSTEGQHYIFSRVSQVGVPQIQTPLTTLRQAALPVPSLAEQTAITTILGKLDDKIELNRRMNETLESIARAIFKSWFVDFGPVRTKMERHKVPAISSDIAALFPSTFHDSVLGEIPLGWNSTRLSGQIDILSGGTPKTTQPEYWNGRVSWISVADTAPGPYITRTEKTITNAGLEQSAAQLLPKETIIITARGTVGNTALTSEPMAMNQSCYGLRGRGQIGQLFLLYQVRQQLAILRANAHGSVFETITRSTFDCIEVIQPPDGLLLAYEQLARSLFDRILLNQRQNETLAGLRDALLPKLMSGEIRLRQAETAVEARS